jgi:large subunit ribosomal protein L23
MRTPEHVIKKPLLTEKGTTLRETGGLTASAEPGTFSTQLMFEVARDANKAEIRRAVEKLWDVDVLKVRTAIVRGKIKRVGRFTGRRPSWKRALVTLAPGQSVEFFEGV